MNNLSNIDYQIISNLVHTGQIMVTFTLVCKDKTNEEFLSKINPTDSFFYFYKDKYMSLSSDYKTKFSSDELLETVRLFFN